MNDLLTDLSIFLKQNNVPILCFKLSMVCQTTNLLTQYSFLQRVQLHCKRCISYGNSVRQSVCLSHAGIVSKSLHVAW